ncbi:hypothetical protein ES708_20759 [subsurface metagenome]
MKQPDYLFHYTNIGSLAYILKDKTFQFSCLELVNDLKEGFAKDFGDLRKYVFVNCWTDNKDEQLPLWNMYTRDMKGVKLKIKTPILQNIEPDKPIDYLFEDFMVLTQREQIYKITYTDIKIDLTPSIFSSSDYLDFIKIGKYKRLIWKFESEWRYILIIIPLEKETEINKNDIIARSSHLIKARKGLGFKKYYRPIMKDAFKNMEITLGPKSNDSDRIIVESLIEKYNPTANLFDSNLKDDIR